MPFKIWKCKSITSKMKFCNRHTIPYLMLPFNRAYINRPGRCYARNVKRKLTLSEWIEFLAILIVGGSIIWWVVIWIRMLICRITGRCPKGRICKDSLCKNKVWCRKYQRYADVHKYIYEVMRENRRRSKKKQP